MRSPCLDEKSCLHFPSKVFMITTMRPYISETLCQRCNECVDTCPYEVFKNEDATVIVAAPEDCIECTACVDSCPVAAISMGD
jgi:NAD-dependent dihydropyrimidine dehydrogenase PreA subunit